MNWRDVGDGTPKKLWQLTGRNSLSLILHFLLTFMKHFHETVIVLFSFFKLGSRSFTSALDTFVWSDKPWLWYNRKTSKTYLKTLDPRMMIAWCHVYDALWHGIDFHFRQVNLTTLPAYLLQVILKYKHDNILMCFTYCFNGEITTWLF